MNYIHSRILRLGIWIIYWCIVACTNKTNLTYSEALEICNKNKEDRIQSSIRVKLDKTCLEGAKLPNFSISDINGAAFTNYKFSKKFTLINFWFIECPPCIKEMPILCKIQSELGDKVEVVGICRNTKSELLEFLSSTTLNFRVVPDGRKILEDVFKHPFGYPTSYLVDKEGVIIKVFFTFDDEEVAYDELKALVSK